MRMRVRFLLLLFPWLALAQPSACQIRTADDFLPMTRSERAADFILQVIGPDGFAETAIQAGIYQGIDRPRGYGQGAEGYGQRFGSLYGQRAIAEAAQYGLGAALHQDNRYFASGRHGFARRLAYAAESTLLARRDDGSRTLALAGIGGAAAGAFLSRAWAPGGARSFGDGAVEFGFAMGLRFGFHLAREFSPRVLGRIVR